MDSYVPHLTNPKPKPKPTLTASDLLKKLNSPLLPPTVNLL